LIATSGKLAAAGPRFSFANRRLTAAVVDVAISRMNQARTASFTPNLEGNDAQCVECDFSWPEIIPQDQPLKAEPWETGNCVKEEEFSRAVALGLFDYMRKSRSKGFVVSLSGGADSSAVACLVKLMIRFAVRDLGLGAFLEKTHCPPPPQGTDMPDSETGLTRQLLTCVYQATRHSSDTTRNAARTVAEHLGAEFFEFQIDAMVDQYVKTLEGALNRPLTWERDDIALQNIQARVRAPGVWMLANIRNALLLATSDRSEASVGYATMDGDTCGGLSPIAGIDKAFLLKWLKWMETEGPHGVGRFEALRVVNAQAPTPELRPKEARQTAEGDLMPYDLLDAIERSAVRDKRSPLEVFRVVRESFRQYDPGQLARWIERYFALWCRNQWKRERYAPSFHLDDENLDPKTWCRFPILSGGYQRELAILREAALLHSPSSGRSIERPYG
jgi:NAD+ synthase (glutamine-hydrolysing)